MGTRTRAAELRGLGRQLMCMDHERIGFVGPMGNVTRRSMGAVTIYLALDAPFQFRLDGEPWRETIAAVVPPFIAHGFISNDKLMAALMIEPEVIDWTTQCRKENVGFDALRTYMRKAYADFMSAAGAPDQSSPLNLERCQQLALCGEDVRRKLDPRIARVIGRLQMAPHERITASRCANTLSLSFSRFLHLFRKETGLPFRSFVAWKRARLVLKALNQQGPLTELAQDIGYPDLSYFSNSVRNAYGLAPREMFARCAQTTLRSTTAPSRGQPMQGFAATHAVRVHTHACN